MWGQLLLFVVLGVIVYQDFQERAISLWTIPVLFFAGLYLAFYSIGWEWWFLAFNLFFIGVQVLGVTLYFSIKHQRFVNITQQYLGSGDLLFFIAISPLFAPLQFCLFFIGSLVLILLVVFGYQFIFPKLNTIPLAGAMGLCTLVYMFVFYYYNYSTYNDWLLLEFFYG